MASSRRLVISTCGTSLLTNELDAAERSLLLRHANARRVEVTEPERSALAAILERQTAAFAASDIAAARRRSAEINGLVAIYGGQTPPGGDHQLLVHSDTWPGAVAAEAVAGWLRSQGASVEPYCCRDLNTARLDHFRVALGELAQWAREIVPSYRQRGYEIVFNLTGGFKSLQGYMQALGMFLADRCCYLFEGPNSELLTVPRLPVRLDLDRVVQEHSLVFRRLAIGQTLPRAECAAIHETLLFEIEGQCSLSEWGELAWGEAREAIYDSPRLLEPLTDRLRYSPALESEYARLERRRRLQVHQRLDDLAGYVLSNRAKNLNRLDVKRLARPVEGSTHEADAWADGDARRLFLHWEGATLVVDRLGQHL